MAKSKGKESDHVIRTLQQELGEGIGGKDFKVPEVGRIPTGIFPLDLAIGGGIPLNRVSIIYGPESSTKTSLLLKIIRAFQQRKQTVALIEPEYSLDPVWSGKIGVNLKDLALFRPDNAEQAVDVMEAMMYADDVGLVCLDSIAALVTHNEIESEAGKQIVAGASLLTGKLVKKIGAAFSSESKRKHFPTVILLNQIRNKIGVMYGDPETMPGGNALRFISALTLRLYAKNKLVKEINPDVPVFKEVSGTIRKAKIPVAGLSFTYDMCILDHSGMKVGDVDAWHTVQSYLKATGGMVKNDKGTGWTCYGEKFNTIEQVHERYDMDPIFAEMVNSKLFSEVNKFVPEEK